MMFATPFKEYIPPQAFVKALDLIFLLHADHEQNASTTTVRIAGSSDANPLACVAAGIASLWGPMHVRSFTPAALCCAVHNASTCTSPPLSSPRNSN